MMMDDDDDWLSDSDGMDDSDDELDLPDSAPRSNETGTGAEEEDVESEEDGEPTTFDVALPVRHSYLGNNLQEARGHTLMDLEAGDEPVQENTPITSGPSSSRNRGRGQICQIPLLPTYSGVSMALVPGQTLPMTLYHPQAISMLRLALTRGRTFGIVAIRNDSEDEDDERNTFFLPTRRNRVRSYVSRQFGDDDYPLWDVGTTAEIFEFQEEDDGSLIPQDEERSFLGFTLKAKGSQRFRLLDIHRQVDGNRLAKVQILPEIILPNPLHECHIACLDRVRSESPLVKPEVGGLVYRKPMPNSSQDLEAAICSLIKERRKGDDTVAWERICEVKRSIEEGKVQKRLVSAQEPKAKRKYEGDSRNDARKEPDMESDNSVSSKGKEGDRVKKDSDADIKSSFINTGKGEGNNVSDIVISEKSRTKREHDKSAGVTKEKDDGGSPPKSKPPVFMLENRKIPYSRWCRKRDAALTVWPDWLYDLYDASVLVSRMQKEFKALHLRKKMEKSVFGKWSSGFKPSGEGPLHPIPWIPNDPVELSFWVAQNLPLDDKQRVKLLRMNSAIQRLRWELGVMEKCQRLSCSNCGQKIADQRHAFCMSVAGPQGTYVNPGGYVHEALTLSKARGLKVVTHPPSTEHSWFPGYAWSIVECSRCAQHMGWLFTVASSANQQLKPLRFWGLCRKSLITGQTRVAEEDTA